MQNPNGYPGGHPFVAGYPGQVGFPTAGGFSVPTIADHSKSAWTEYKTPEGRPYYFNSVTKITSWEKPEELMTESERAGVWKEFKTDDGKTYYYNTVTKTSSWTKPPELENKAVSSASAKQQGETLAKENSQERSVESSSTTPPPQDQKSRATRQQAQLEEGEDESSNSNMPSEAPVSEPSLTPPRTQAPTEPVKSDFEQFKEILRDKNIASNASWENCLKFVSNDPRFERFRTHPERKQFFNAYKTQRAKEEKEEQKNKVKRAKENLENFLRTSERMNSAIRYRHACEMFGTMDSWKLVPDAERREIFEEAISDLIKKEKEEARELRKRNMRVLTDILDSMTQITYRTTWSEAQQLLLDNSTFNEDDQLLGMDKEDALIVFEDHIRQLENDEANDKMREKKIQQRNQRRNREEFIKLLDELHASGKLNSLSKWSNLYHDISADPRFEAMLSQPLSGSTPLDLFKFYVEDLKDRYEGEKKVIKDILNAANFVMTPDTEFSEFVTVLSQDPRSGKLDSGNVKLMHEKLLEREREKFREKQREEMKSRKKLESIFLNLLSRLNPPLSENSTWEEVRPQICGDASFHAIPTEEERIQLFEDAIRSLVETCSHHHNHKQGHHKHGRCGSEMLASSSLSGRGNSSSKSSRDHRSKDRHSSKKSSSRNQSSRSRRSRSSSVASHRSSESNFSMDSRNSRSSSSLSRRSSSSSSMPPSFDDTDDEQPTRDDYRRDQRSSSRQRSSHHQSQHKSGSSHGPMSQSGSRSPSYHNRHRSPGPNGDNRKQRSSGHRRSHDRSLSPIRESKRAKVDNYSSSRPKDSADLEELERQRNMLLMQLQNH